MAIDAVPARPVSLAGVMASARRRVDYVLVWGHGLPHVEDILAQIESACQGRSKIVPAAVSLAYDLVSS